ncbi:MAG: DUF1801 domain-containing protein [Chitinivibrionales bacterium]|nr:DUF1801 domain-containing protein [Chitinivibrionales bacterium]
MAELKTQKNKQSVTAFLDSISDDKRKNDSKTINKLMKKITGQKPSMWGDSIVGFGTYRYKYASGREGDWFRVGFSPRKQNLTLYIMPGFEKHDTLMNKLGRYKTAKSCLYIKKLEDVDMNVLEELIKKSYDYMSK